MVETPRHVEFDATHQRGEELRLECTHGDAPAVGTRRAVGLNPTMPHSAAGMRQEPPVSVPSAPNAMASVTDTAAPEDEPPGT